MVSVFERCSVWEGVWRVRECDNVIVFDCSSEFVAVGESKLVSVSVPVSGA